MEKQRRTELEQKLFKQAGEHYHRSLLLQRGITPWRRLVEQSHAYAEVNTQTNHTHIHTCSTHRKRERESVPSLFLCFTSCPHHTGAFTPLQTLIKMDIRRILAGEENREE